jgi:hypothetical protein
VLVSVDNPLGSSMTTDDGNGLRDQVEIERLDAKFPSFKSSRSPNGVWHGGQLLSSGNAPPVAVLFWHG